MSKYVVHPPPAGGGAKPLQKIARVWYSSNMEILNPDSIFFYGRFIVLIFLLLLLVLVIEKTIKFRKENRLLSSWLLSGWLTILALLPLTILIVIANKDLYSTPAFIAEMSSFLTDTLLILTNGSPLIVAIPIILILGVFASLWIWPILKKHQIKYRLFFAIWFAVALIISLHVILSSFFTIVGYFIAAGIG